MQALQIQLPGESMFMSVFRCDGATGHLALANPIAGFLYAGGNMLDFNLAAGEQLRVDTGCIVSMADSVTYDIQFVGGFRNALFGGEGLFYATLTGPGHVVLQTLPFSRLANRIAAAVGSSKEQSKGFGGIAGDIVGNIISGDD